MKNFIFMAFPFTRVWDSDYGYKVNEYLLINVLC
jgi:hypothetical protein